MSNFIKVAYGTVSGAGIDTKNMSTEEVVDKFKELSGGKNGWGEKAYGGEKIDETQLKEINKNKESGSMQDYKFDENTPQSVRDKYKKSMRKVIELVADLDSGKITFDDYKTQLQQLLNSDNAKEVASYTKAGRQQLFNEKK